MNATSKAIAYALAQWHAHEPKPCVVIDFAAERAKRQQQQQTRTKPGGEAA